MLRSRIAVIIPAFWLVVSGLTLQVLDSTGAAALLAVLAITLVGWGWSGKVLSLRDSVAAYPKGERCWSVLFINIELSALSLRFARESARLILQQCQRS